MILNSLNIWSFIGVGSLVISLFMVLMWLVSRKMNDVSIIDRVWGINFILIALTYAALTPAFYWRNILVLVLVTVWGLRLSAHIHMRNRGKPEDIRYQRIRGNYGSSFWWKSLFVVFFLQGALALLISAPILWVFKNPPGSIFGIWDLLGISAWATGFYFEAVGDLQLLQFKKDPNNRGKLLTTGLWSLTRHPNYFGDALQWWGFFFFAMALPLGLMTAIGPIVMGLFLRYVSGVTLLEKDLKVSKPGFEEYIKNTPAFIPNLRLFAAFRFLFFVLVKISTRIFYRFEVEKIQPWPKDAWKNVRIAILLNHTSLIEPIYCGVLPLSYLWRLSTHGIFPAAAETLNRPLVGALIRFLAPKVGTLSRKYDDTWQDFLNSIAPTDTMIFLPEGRMKRPNGLDKHGQPMTIKRGITEVLIKIKRGPMVIAYSGGLHHVQSPGQGLPRLFKTLKIKFEAVDIEQYLHSFHNQDGSGDMSNVAIQDAIVKDLEKRRNAYCE